MPTDDWLTFMCATGLAVCCLNYVHLQDYNRPLIIFTMASIDCNTTRIPIFFSLKASYINKVIVSLRKQPTVRHDTTGFLLNDCRNSTLVTHHYLDLGSDMSSVWIFYFLRKQSSGGIVKCWLFPQATKIIKNKNKTFNYSGGLQLYEAIVKLV